VAAAVAIVVLGNFFRDAIDTIVDTSSTWPCAATWRCGPDRAAARTRRHELLRLPGVLQAESARFVPVNLVNGHRRERGQIRAYTTGVDLYRVVDIDNQVQPLPDDGW
jgi:putative ABC transport system permease protein